jgi:hypothetical protein
MNTDPGPHGHHLSWRQHPSVIVWPSEPRGQSGGELSFLDLGALLLFSASTEVADFSFDLQFTTADVSLEFKLITRSLPCSMY